jgi:hypothetical protein
MTFSIDSLAESPPPAAAFIPALVKPYHQEYTANKLATPNTVVATTNKAANPPALKATTSGSREPLRLAAATLEFALTETHIPAYPLIPEQNAPNKNANVVNIATL